MFCDLTALAESCLGVAGGDVQLTGAIVEDAVANGVAIDASGGGVYVEAGRAALVDVRLVNTTSVSESRAALGGGVFVLDGEVLFCVFPALFFGPKQDIRGLSEMLQSTLHQPECTLG